MSVGGVGGWVGAHHGALRVSVGGIGGWVGAHHGALRVSVVGGWCNEITKWCVAFI